MINGNKMCLEKEIAKLQSHIGEERIKECALGNVPNYWVSYRLFWYVRIRLQFIFMNGFQASLFLPTNFGGTYFGI